MQTGAHINTYKYVDNRGLYGVVGNCSVGALISPRVGISLCLVLLLALRAQYGSLSSMLIAGNLLENKVLIESLNQVGLTSKFCSSFSTRVRLVRMFFGPLDQVLGHCYRSCSRGCQGTALLANARMYFILFY